MVVEMCFEETGRQVAGGVEELRDAFRAELELIAGGGAENLHAIAGRDDQSFAHDVAVDELAQTTGAGFVVKGESLADLYRSCLVIDSDEKNGHMFSHKKAQKRALLKHVVST